jgi:uncharacterized membrane protein YciS (DUF1049 family)
METLKYLSDIIQAIIICAGIIIGGLWTYFLFIRQRLGLPKLEIELSVNEVLLSEETKLIHVELKLLNVGSVVLTSNLAEVRLRQIVPIPSNVEDLIKGELDPVPQDKTEIEWPMLAERNWNWDQGKFEIEPGEGDSLHADFITPIEIKTAEFYFFIANSKKEGQGIGWTLTSIYHFKPREDMEMSQDNVKSIADKKLVTGQQSRQRQQPNESKQQQRQPKQKPQQPKSKDVSSK